MKKLIFFTLFLFATILGFSQQITYGDSLIITGGGNFGGTVQLSDPVNNEDAATKGWVLTQGTVAVDSSYWSAIDGYLVLYKGGVATDSTNLDNRYALISSLLDYLMFSDTVSIVATQRYVDSLLALATDNVYTITLPSSTTIAGRIVGASEGTDYPTGWVLTEGANPSNIDIAHNLGRRVASVNIFYNVSGTEYKQLVNFNNAYSGVTTPTVNSLRIEGLTTIQKSIKIFIEFE